jgi:hypothetical protein
MIQMWRIFLRGWLVFISSPNISTLFTLTSCQPCAIFDWLEPREAALPDIISRANLTSHLMVLTPQGILGLWFRKDHADYYNINFIGSSREEPHVAYSETADLDVP